MVYLVSERSTKVQSNFKFLQISINYLFDWIFHNIWTLFPNIIISAWFFIKIMSITVIIYEGLKNTILNYVMIYGKRSDFTFEFSLNSSWSICLVFFNVSRVLNQDNRMFYNKIDFSTLVKGMRNSKTITMILHRRR